MTKKSEEPIVSKRSDLYKPWSVKKEEIGEIKGDEELISKNWEELEDQTFSYIMFLATYM